mmetsp:Transcript_19013/g.62798  ORF Transcript_19013/g.62798 Transcript_19013/m.62798 type:complete len:226 (-) Transcript_19013:1085-1762(-)
MRPTACVSHESNSCCDPTRSGWRKIACEAWVRLAPAADSSRKLSSSTRASPFLSVSCWKSSITLERCVGVPLSIATRRPAAVSASCTFCSRSGNCTKTSTRSSSRVRPISDATADSFAPKAPPAPSAVSEPSSPTRMTQPGRTAALQPGCGHSCRSACSHSVSCGPAWPHDESRLSEEEGWPAARPGSEPPRWTVRTASKKRRERTRPTSSFCSRRSRCTWSRVQ